TADGTVDGVGTVIGDANADYRNSGGYILTGPEYITVFDGLTGAELDTKAFQVPRGTVSVWGDGYGNRVDRFVGSVAFLDDTGRPSVVMGRGMYTRTTFSAWNYRDGALTLAWVVDHPNNGAYGGKGAHSMSIANIDDDPNQEIINGGATFDHDGQGICSVPFYAHGDALHVTDHVVDRPGLEVFMPYEASGVPAYSMRDAATCEILWKGPNSPGEGPGRGVAADVDPNSPGSEAWTNATDLMHGTDGQPYTGRPSSTNFLIWWDGDPSRELLDSNRVRQFDSQGGILTAEGCSSNNGTKSVPTLSADLIGDWREEVVFRCGNTLRIYSTPEPAQQRIYTLMHDAQYRAAISWQNGGYNQPPHPSFHIGAGMAEPPRPSFHFTD
ncbi:MAG TPA: rhamnogalacturonan lyase, partial [Polyangiaceae bacterium]|nr:rhamnogalacturonan lyase [Polyangiaceae bacterium]